MKVQYSKDGIEWHDHIDYPHDTLVQYDGIVEPLTYREFSEDGIRWFWGRKPRSSKYFRDRIATDVGGERRPISEDENAFTD